MRHPSPFFERIRWAQERGAFADRVGRSILAVLHVQPDDPVTRQLAESRIHSLERRAASGSLPPFKASQLHAGELALGKDPYGRDVKVLLRWLCSGLLLVANTGGGKSNLVSWIVLQLAHLNCPTWLFEPYKIQLRRLRPLCQRYQRPLAVLPWRQWRWNLLQSPLEDPRLHMATAVDLLTRVLNIPGRAGTILRQGIHELFTRFGVWKDNATRFPTLFHLYEWVRTQAGLNVPARDAIMDRLGSFLTVLTPQVGAWNLAWSPADLARHSVVFEMRGAAESVRSLLPQSLLFSTFQSRVEAGLCNGPLELFIFFEDSQRLFDDASAANAGQVTPLDELAGIIRGSGLGFGPVLQSTIGFSRRLRPNLALKLFGRLGCHDDLVTLAADCALDPEQIAFAQHRLVPGTFIGRASEGNWTEPFLFHVPHIQLPGSPTEDEVQSSLAPLNALPARFADEFAHWEAHPVVVVQGTAAAGVPATPETPAAPVLSEAELRFLRAIVANPGQPASFYCRATRLNGTRLAELRRNLASRGFIREHTIAANARGRTSIVIEPLPSAHQAVASQPDPEA